jgi:hypothetical protein
MQFRLSEPRWVSVDVNCGAESVVSRYELRLKAVLKSPRRPFAANYDCVYQKRNLVSSPHQYCWMMLPPSFTGFVLADVYAEAQQNLFAFNALFS